jgi:hypothetical protein
MLLFFSFQFFAHPAFDLLVDYEVESFFGEAFPMFSKSYLLATIHLIEFFFSHQH